ncbi:hypothetical protein ACFL6C_02765 [Myxococcota bacterium]
MKRQKSAALVLVAATVTGLGRPVHASMFGEENVILGKLLATELREALEIAEAVVTIKEALAVAKETAAFARDAVQVVQNIALIIDDPIGYLRANALQFVKSFPEVNSIMRDVATIKATIRNFGEFRGYDPYAFARVLEDLRRQQDAAYELVIHAVDHWGINDPHDQMLEQLRENQQRAAEIVAEIAHDSLIGRLTPQAAAVYAAQAAGIDAQASVEVAAWMQELARIMKVRTMGEVATNNQARVDLLNQLTTYDHEMPSWQLTLSEH